MHFLLGRAGSFLLSFKSNYLGGFLFCLKVRKRRKNCIRKRLSATTGESNLGGDLTRPRTHTKVHSRSFLSAAPIKLFPFLVYGCCSVTLSCGTARQYYQRNRSCNSLIIQLHIHLTPRELKIFLRTKEVVGWRLVLKDCLTPRYRTLST